MNDRACIVCNRAFSLLFFHTYTLSGTVLYMIPCVLLLRLTSLW